MRIISKSKCKDQDYVYYLAAALADTVLGAETYDVLETYKGKDLEFKEYEPLLYPVAAEKESVLCCM